MRCNSDWFGCEIVFGCAGCLALRCTSVLSCRVSRSALGDGVWVVVCYHRYDSAGSVQLQISLSTRVSLVSTAPQIPPTDVSPPVTRGRSHDNKQRRSIGEGLDANCDRAPQMNSDGGRSVGIGYTNLPKGDLGAIDAVEPQASRDGCLDSTGSRTLSTLP